MDNNPNAQWFKGEPEQIKYFIDQALLNDIATTHWSIQSAVPQLPIPVMSLSSNTQRMTNTKAIMVKIVSRVMVKKSLNDLPYLLKTG